MLQNIRDNAQGMIAKTIIVVLILSLSIWGLDSIVGGSGEAEIASVDGESISEREFQRMVQIERQQRLMEMDDPDPSRIDRDQLNEDVLERLIHQKLLGMDVEKRGLSLTEEDVDRMITQEEAFQVNGRFSQERFMQAVRNQGMTVDEFRKAVERDYLTQMMQAVIQGSAFATAEESRYVAGLFTQTRTFSAMELPLDRMADEIEVSDAEVEEYYNANQSDFERPRTVDVSWIVLDREDLIDRVDVDDADVRELYERRAEEERREERNAAHILIQDGDDADERVQAVEEALADGGDFADLAREYSDDGASAEAGGELGFASRDSYDEAFSDALFGIEEEGEFVGPVETEFGRHFIKLLGVQAEDPPSFESLEAELRREVAQEQAGRRFAELSEELADMAYSEYDLEAPAELIGVDIQERDGVTEEDSEAPFDHPELISQIFSEDVLEGGFNTELVDVASDRSVVARVRDYHPAAQMELSEVEDEIRERLRTEKMRDRLEEKLAEMIERLRDGDDDAMDEVAATMQGEWVRYDQIDRNAQHINPVLREAVFGLGRPGDSGPRYEVVPTPQGMALIRLDAVEAGDEEATEMVFMNMRQSLSQRHGAAAYSFYVEQLRENATVERP